MIYFIPLLINTLIINQIPTFPIIPNTIGPLITINPGILTLRPLSTSRIFTRPIFTTRSTLISESTSTLTSTISSISLESNNITNNDSDKPININNLELYIILPIFGLLLLIGTLIFFKKRRNKLRNINLDSVDRLYDSIDYSAVYEVPKQSNLPPPIPERSNYGVQVTSSL
jgi:LPXTG-motif cell wall-anchored protein